MTLTGYAEEKKLFEKAGLKVELVPFSAGPSMLPAFAASQIDIGWMGEFPIVSAYANGMPIEMIMIERFDATNFRLVVDPSAGINSLKDLKGKRIAVTIGSSSHLHIGRALRIAGLRQGDVTIVNLQPGSMPAAYEAGQIDGAFTVEPHTSIIEHAGGKVIATTKSLGDITGLMLAARSDFTKTHPEEIQKFLAAWQEAEADKSDDVLQYAAKHLGTTVPEYSAMMQRMSSIYPPYREQLTQEYLGVPGQAESSKMMAHLKDIGEFLLVEKRINALPADWSRIINTKPLETYVANVKH
jgi:aliphatic sulfonates family ABC transporter substrate-binding protein